MSLLLLTAMQYVSMFSQLENLITDARKKTPAFRPVLIGIDGRSGAGKSTLALRIRESFQDVAVVHKDDFYSSAPEHVLAELPPSEGCLRYFEWQRLLGQVLLPLSSGTDATFQCYDWVQKSLGAWRTVPASCRYVVIEGVYALRPELREYYDMKVRVNTREEIRAARLITRGENSAEWVRRWSSAEDFYFQSIFLTDGVFDISGQIA